MKSFWLRFLNMMTGLFLYALGIVIAIQANIGYAPWEVFHVGLAGTTGLTIGVVSIIAGIIIMVIVTALKEKFGLGTILSMILTGVFLDIIFMFNVIPLAQNMIIGVCMLLAGLYIISLGSYFYIKSAFGVGPRDNLMVVLARKTNLPVGVCRFAVELSVTIAGWLLGGMVGIGTIISAFSIGLFVQLTFKLFKFDVTAVNHETLLDTWTNLKIRVK